MRTLYRSCAQGRVRPEKCSVFAAPAIAHLPGRADRPRAGESGEAVACEPRAAAPRVGLRRGVGTACSCSVFHRDRSRFTYASYWSRYVAYLSDQNEQLFMTRGGRRIAAASSPLATVVGGIAFAFGKHARYCSCLSAVFGSVDLPRHALSPSSGSGTSKGSAMDGFFSRSQRAATPLQRSGR